MTNQPDPTAPAHLPAHAPDYAALFDASPYPYLLIAPDYTLIGANAAYLKAAGAVRADILGKHIFEAFPANAADPDATNLGEVGRSIDLAISTGRPHTSALLRYDVPRHDGAAGFDFRLWSAVHTPVFDGAGRVAFVAQTAIDVTDLYRLDEPTGCYVLRKNAAAAPDALERSRPQLHEALTRILNAERTQLHVLFDHAPGFVAVLNAAEHTFAMVNEAFYELVGQRDLIGRTLADALPELAGDDLLRPLEEALRSGRPVMLQNRRLALRRAPGTDLAERYVDLVFQPVLDANGAVSVVCVQGHDVSAASRASLALKDKVAQLEAAKARQAMLLKLGDHLRSQSDDPEAMMDAANRELAGFLDVPRVGYVAFGDATAALVLNTYADPARVPPLPVVVEAPDEYGALVMNALRAGRHIAVDDMATDPRTAGAVALAHAAIGARASLAVPILRNGRAVAFMFAHDDRPRRWSEDDVELMVQTADRTWEAIERARALVALRDTDKRKDEFLAMLAHELRNPLAPIGAAAQLLQLARVDAARVRHTSEIIGRQVQHMTGLIDDLLDVSRVTRGLITLDLARIDLRDVIADAVEQVDPLIAARNHRLVLALPPQRMPVDGDRKRLVQAVGNILNNAAKYTPEGGRIALTASVQGDGPGAHLVIEVADSGVGMAPELARRVFELFAQAERTSDRTSGGLGLGLALVKSLVELHHGTVGCTSPGPGQGSTFRICLPAPAPADGAGPQAQTDAAAPADGPAAAPAGAEALRILVVDDNVDAAAMLAMLLETMGHTVAVEHGPLAALAWARTHRPQVCLLDIGLPEMDGLELARRLRALPNTRDAVLVAVTGYGQRDDREGALAAGFDHHLVKPVDIERLVALLDGIGAR